MSWTAWTWKLYAYLYCATALKWKLQAIAKCAFATNAARAAAIVVGLNDAMEWIIEFEINLQQQGFEVSLGESF